MDAAQAGNKRALGRRPGSGMIFRFTWRRFFHITTAIGRMIDCKQFECWFVAGSQHLYGSKALEKVAANARQIAAALDAAPNIPATILFQPVIKSAEEASALCLRANADPACAGLITWCHTFSPSQMWINGLRLLRRPLLHFHTQHNRDIPWATIDMDFMNLNQSAHGDREHGFIMSRMRLNRKVVAGFWREAGVQARIGAWTRAAAAWHDWQGAKFCRFGDNMREVAVTEGDKVAAQIQFGFSFNGYGVGDLARKINQVTDRQIDALIKEYQASYNLAPNLRADGAMRASLREAARIEA